jgi:RHS repeat-associated protein
MFATYRRDATGLDYANQRYYSSTVARFLTPDPYQASGGPADPQSWNRYAYVQNDPINFTDPTGLLIKPHWVDWGGGGGWNWGGGSGFDGPWTWRPELPPDRPDHRPGRGGGGWQPPANRVTVDDVEFTDLALLARGSRTYDMVNTLFVGLTQVMDPDCQNWLTGGTVNNLGGLFSSAMTVMGSATGIVDTRNPGGVVNAMTGVGANQVGIALNQQGAFFSSSVTTNNGRISGNTDRARVFILIHELAHFNQVPGFLSDRGNPGAGTSNNSTINEHCRRTLGRSNGRDQSWRP